jgi:hypothetical protein
MLAQVIYFGYRLGEISCPTRYFAEASSIDFARSVRYGIGVIVTSLRFRLQKLGWLRTKLFTSGGTRLLPDYYHQIEPGPKNQAKA